MKGWRCLQEVSRNVIWTQKKWGNGQFGIGLVKVIVGPSESVIADSPQVRLCFWRERRHRTGTSRATGRPRRTETQREGPLWPARPCLFWQDRNGAWCTFKMFDTGMTKCVKGKDPAVCGWIVENRIVYLSFQNELYNETSRPDGASIQVAAAWAVLPLLMTWPVCFWWRWYTGCM